MNHVQMQMCPLQRWMVVPESAHPSSVPSGSSELWAVVSHVEPPASAQHLSKLAFRPIGAIRSCGLMAAMIKDCS